MACFRDLLVWQKAMALAVGCYRITQSFPREELFGMVSQIRRCSVSVPANIAEGHARSHTKAYLNHLSIARGSLAELETHLLLGHELGYLLDDDLESLLRMTDEVSRMIAGIRKTLRNRL